jgi:hypothetical protein
MVSSLPKLIDIVEKKTFIETLTTRNSLSSPINKNKRKALKISLSEPNQKRSIIRSPCAHTLCSAQILAAAARKYKLLKLVCASSYIYRIPAAHTQTHTHHSLLPHIRGLAALLAAFWQPRPFTRKRVVCFIGDGLRVSFRRDLMDRYNVNRAQTRRRSIQRNLLSLTRRRLGAGRVYIL